MSKVSKTICKWVVQLCLAILAIVTVCPEHMAESSTFSVNDYCGHYTHAGMYYTCGYMLVQLQEDQHAPEPSSDLFSSALG